MAAEELREKRSLVGGLQVANEALQDELADTKKRLLQATVDLEDLSKARDRLRVELKVRCWSAQLPRRHGSSHRVNRPNLPALEVLLESPQAARLQLKDHRGRWLAQQGQIRA